MTSHPQIWKQQAVGFGITPYVTAHSATQSASIVLLCQLRHNRVIWQIALQGIGLLESAAFNGTTDVLQVVLSFSPDLEACSKVQI